MHHFCKKYSKEIRRLAADWDHMTRRLCIDVMWCSHFWESRRRFQDFQLFERFIFVRVCFQLRRGGMDRRINWNHGFIREIS